MMGDYKLLVVLDTESLSDINNPLRYLWSDTAVRGVFDAIYRTEEIEEITERIHDHEGDVVVVVGPVFWRDKGVIEKVFAKAGLPAKGVVFIRKDNSGFLCEHLGLIKGVSSVTDIVRTAVE